MSPLLLLVFGALAVAVLGGAFLLLAPAQPSNRRAKAIAAGRSGSASAEDPADAKRRRETQEMLDGLRKRDADKQDSVKPKDMAAKLEQAGLSLPVSVFYAASLVGGLALLGFLWNGGIVSSGILVPFTGGIVIPGIALGAAALFVGAVGIPRWVVGTLTKRRHGKMVNQFADAIDIIVRGVKSGLPLNECLRIIARESPDPLASEFVMLTDSLQMGTDLERALSKFYARVPLQEVNFFCIVLLIQSKSGGNLSEALGNLSTVIRSRRMMREKIKALSSEAKASASIIGCLPFAVGTMVFMTTPDYIMQLFITPTGHGILFMGAVLLGLGITVMRNMISFEI